MNRRSDEFPANLDLSDDDIYKAMKEIEGYIDVTPGDFREIYKRAFHQAFERITTSVKAKDIMSRNVLFVRIDTPLKEVAALMAGSGISGVPVVDERGDVAGVISEKDFLARMGGKDSRSFMGVVAECLKGKGCVAISVRAQKAADLMTHPAVTVSEEATAMEIAGLFTEKKINRVPVVDNSGKLTGIVSRTDVVRSLLKHTLSERNG